MRHMVPKGSLMHYTLVKQSVHVPEAIDMNGFVPFCGKTRVAAGGRGRCGGKRVRGKRCVKAKARQGTCRAFAFTHRLYGMRRSILRRKGDSNPRYGFPYTHFPGVRLKPLGHLSCLSVGWRKIDVFSAPLLNGVLNNEFFSSYKNFPADFCSYSLLRA